MSLTQNSNPNAELVKDLIKLQYARLATATNTNNFIDIHDSKCEAFPVELALESCLSNVALCSLAGADTVRECFRDLQRHQGFDFIRGFVYEPEPVEQIHSKVQEVNGYKYVNRWTKPRHILEHQDLQPFFSFMCRLFPEKGDREFIYQWMAMLTWHPEQKSCGLLLKGPQGTGKSSFIKLLVSLVGRENSHVTSNHKCVSGGFNAIWMESVLVGLEEVKNLSNPAAFYNTLKTYISDIEQSGERKGKDIENYNCYSKVVVASNAEVPFPMAEDDRRFAVYYVGHRHDQQETAECMALLVPWIEANTGAIALWLKDKVSDTWTTDAPRTDAKDQLIQNAMPEWECNLVEYIEGKQLVTLDEMSNAIQAHTYSVKPQTIAAKLKSMGWVSDRIRINKGDCNKSTVMLGPDMAHIAGNTKKIREVLNHG